MYNGEDSNKACLHGKGGKATMADKQPLVRGGSLQQDKGYWVVRARVYDQVRRKYRQHSKSTGIKTKEHRKREAERMIPDILANWEAEAQAALYPVPDDPPFSVYVTRYLEARTKDLKATTATAYKSNARLHVLPKLGDRKVSEVMNCTPFVRQYDILSNKWGVLLCQKEYQTNDIRQNSKNW